MGPRVIIVTPDIVGPVKNGGIGTACFHYARTLAIGGFAVDVLFTGNIDEASRDHWRDRYRSMGIDFLCMNNVPIPRHYTYGTYWYTETSSRVMDFLRNAHYDYILFQDWHANGFWTTRARKMGVAFADTKIGIITHSPNEWQKSGMETFGEQPLEEADLEWCEKQAIAGADVLISPSQHMIGWLKANGYSLPEAVEICPYTFEDDIHAGDPAHVDYDHLIFFGRLETRKGLHILADALRAMASAGERLPKRVSLLGKYASVEGTPSDQYIAELERDLPSVEITTHTDFDYRTAVDYIRQANGVVVIPSILDNYPLTVLESITNGFCFVASTAGGIPEMIDRAVAFAPTAAGLRELLVRLERIDFSRLQHQYDPARARQTWLDHVREATATRVPAAERVGRAHVEVLREPIPPISVCIPFFRHGRYLERLVDALLGMKVPELQLVIVNDGSPQEDLAEFTALRERLEPGGHVFYSQTNAGPGAARNRAIELAAHELILLFDADNVPFPDMVAKLWSAMSCANAHSMAAPYAAVPPLSHAPRPKDVLFHFQPAGGCLPMALLHNTLGDIGSLIWRDVVRSVGGFRTTRDSWEDWEFFFKVASKGFRHLVYPDPLFYYTHDPMGRHQSSHEYRNRLSLLACLEEIDPSVAVGIAQVLAKDLYSHLPRQPNVEVQLQQRLDAVYRSGSWRVTAPLRTVGKALQWRPLRQMMHPRSHLEDGNHAGIASR